MQNTGSADRTDSGVRRADSDPEGGQPMNAHVETLSLIRDTTPCHDALSLTSGGPLARIVLNDQIYSLRITRAGKLILTK
jgi:hypothetical protein